MAGRPALAGGFVFEVATEADTCRVAILPKLYSAGWSDDQLREQWPYTAGRIVPQPLRRRGFGGQGPGAYRKKQKRVDYLLRLNRDTRLAVVEAQFFQRTKDAFRGAVGVRCLGDLIIGKYRPRLFPPLGF